MANGPQTEGNLSSDQGAALIAMIDYIRVEAEQVSPLAAYLLDMAALEITQQLAGPLGPPIAHSSHSVVPRA